MQIAQGFMERFLLSEHIPNKSSVNKAGKFFSCASCYEDAGTLLEWYLVKVRLALSQHINKCTQALSQYAPMHAQPVTTMHIYQGFGKD